MIITVFYFCVSVFGNELNINSDIAVDNFISENRIISNENNEEYISREDCLVAILQCIGATEFTDRRYRNTDFDVPPISGVGKDEKAGYILFAGTKLIAFGRNTETVRGIFYSDEKVKLKECLAFMVRCLEDPFSAKVTAGNRYRKIKEMENSGTLPNNDALFERAENIGLITSADEFYNETYVSYEVFEILIKRFLMQKRYLYVTEENKDLYTRSARINLVVDFQREMTYIEYLSGK